MAGITDLLAQALTPQVVGQIANQLGVDNQTAQQGINVAVPLLVSALSRNAANPQGASALAGAIQRDHTGAVLQNPVAAVNSSNTTADGSKILGHILGADRGPIEQTISNGTGIDAGALLQILAPLLMGSLGKQMQTGQVTPQTLPSALQNQQQQYQQQNGGLMSVITSLLDSNRDGSALDEVAGMLGQALQNRGARG